MTAKKQWSELDERTRRLIIITAATDITLRVAALIDIKRRPASEINGRRWLWATAMAVISSAGIAPIVYFVFGRRQRHG